MSVTLRVSAWQDRRTDELRRHSDSVEVKRWRARVALNEKRRAALARRQIQVVSRLGPLGPDRQGGCRTITDLRPVTQRDPGASCHPANPSWRLLFVRRVHDGWTTLRRLLAG